MGSINMFEEERSTNDNTPRCSETGLDILIVGGGIGGLMCALECWRKGHSVRVLERSKEENQLGKVLSRPSMAADSRG